MTASAALSLCLPTDSDRRSSVPRHAASPVEAFKNQLPSPDVAGVMLTNEFVMQKIHLLFWPGVPHGMAHVV